MENVAQKHVRERFAKKTKWKIPDLSLAPFLSHIFLGEKASLWLKAVLFPDYMRREQTAAKVSLLIPMACQRTADAELIWSYKHCICLISATNAHKHTYLWPSKSKESSVRGQSLNHRHIENTYLISFYSFLPVSITSRDRFVPSIANYSKMRM